MLSVILSTHNEASNSFFENILNNLPKTNKVEIIIVDFNSTDSTLDIAKQQQVKNQNIIILSTNLNSRATRLNYGIKQAKFELILLNHPRSLVQVEGIEYLLKHGPTLSWGGFTHKFDINHPSLNFTSWYSNKIRADLRSIFYLDHCIFAKKKLLETVNYIPEIDIFEDTEISLRLKSVTPGLRLPFISKTSAVRFNKNGIFKQVILNQYLKINYFLKRDHIKMNTSYEKGLDLNSEYTKRDHGSNNK